MLGTFIRGVLFETQSGADETTLRANAMSAGYESADITVREITDADVNPPLTLEQYRAAKLAAVQALKVAKRDGGFIVDAIRFDSDMPAQLAYMSLAMELMSDPSYTTSWKASGNLWVTMDAAVFARVRAGVKAHIEACFAKQAQLDYLIQNAASVEELDAIDIEAGW